MPTYRVNPDVQATFVNSEYDIRAEPGEIFETQFFLPTYFPVELLDAENPPALVDETKDFLLNPGDSQVVELTKYHKRVQISLIEQTTDVVHVYLDDEPNVHVVLSQELPDYIKDLLYYGLYKIRIVSPSDNTSAIKVRVHLEVKV